MVDGQMIDLKNKIISFVSIVQLYTLKNWIYTSLPKVNPEA